MIQTEMMAQSKVQGEYYFRKQEMVAGFKFSDNGKFEFFYTYGAMDRSATGSFSVSGDTLKLKSDKEAGKDFTVMAQYRQVKGYTIAINDPQQFLVKDIRCIFFVNGKKEEAFTDEKGELKIDLAYCDTICVQHPFYPDIVTVIKDKNNDNNVFKLSLNPSLEQVSFKGIEFKIAGNHKITCMPNYFMPFEEIEFIKE